jgi:hypothetical protein
LEGPYRDLGEGFARLTGLEGARRGPSRITCVEDVLLELLRNARDAGAAHIYVASSLRARRYRTLTVLDDGAGIPNDYSELIFEPGVTTRHLKPVLDHTPPRLGGDASAHSMPHGAGLSLYHIRNVALQATVLSPSAPTSISVTLDTRRLPERALQSLAPRGSSTRPSKTNILATLANFARASPQTFLYHGSPPGILATLLRYHIYHIIPATHATGESKSRDLHERARGLGLGMSLRTVQRVLSGRVAAVGRVEGYEEGDKSGGGEGRRDDGGEGGPALHLGDDDRERIGAILTRAARAGYLEVEDLGFEVRPGEVVVRARIYEPEDPYEQ